MTEAQAQELRDSITRWRSEAERVGPVHARWEWIFDAEALLAGKRTVLQEHQILGKM